MRVKVNFALLKMMLFVEHSYEVSFNNIASKSVDFNNIFSKSWRQRLDKSPSVNSGKMYVVLCNLRPVSKKFTQWLKKSNHFLS